MMQEMQNIKSHGCGLLHLFLFEELIWLVFRRASLWSQTMWLSNVTTRAFNF